MTLALDPDFFALLAGSYSRLVGKQLVPLEHDDQNAVRWLYEKAPFCVLAHSTDPDPIFIYGNKTAQTCFERVKIHLAAECYDTSALRGGYGRLHPIEEAELEPVFCSYRFSQG
jgi:MEKHLA domain